MFILSLYFCHFLTLLCLGNIWTHHTDLSLPQDQRYGGWKVDCHLCCFVLMEVCYDQWYTTFFISHTIPNTTGLLIHLYLQLAFDIYFQLVDAIGPKQWFVKTRHYTANLVVIIGCPSMWYLLYDIHGSSAPQDLRYYDYFVPKWGQRSFLFS